MDLIVVARGACGIHLTAVGGTVAGMGGSTGPPRDGEIGYRVATTGAAGGASISSDDHDVSNRTRAAIRARATQVATPRRPVEGADGGQ